MLKHKDMMEKTCVFFCDCNAKVVKIMFRESTQNSLFEMAIEILISITAEYEQRTRCPLKNSRRG
jgi:hypothetical protein